MKKYLPYTGIIISFFVFTVIIPSMAGYAIESHIFGKIPRSEQQPLSPIIETGEEGQEEIPETDNEEINNEEKETVTEQEIDEGKVPESSTGAAPVNRGKPSRRHVLGYYTVDYPGDVRSHKSFQNNINYIDSIATFSYRVDRAGNLHGTTPREGVNLALEKGVAPLVLIHNYRDGSFSDVDARSLLTSVDNRRRLINNVVKVLQRDGYQGVNIDIENVPPGDRRHYTALVREFRETLEPLGFFTTVSIPAKTWDDPYNYWSGAFDYAAIGRHADWVQIMTYDEHWFGGPPGPIASLPWVERVVKYAVSQVPREKILLGIATYGYDWSYTGNRGVTAGDIWKIIERYRATPRWSNTHSVPYFHYYQNGVRHEVWYENAQSARLKFDLVNRYNLKGIGIWNLGSEETAFWQAVAGKLR